ncbi:hypothetical protein V9K67_21560 [Paraflavisolibacter sp. H34]|uniref:hypothetical protein n=1 Tax=Huijunlia imazamoxiresistens TaxID=3127457 RepID=UPI00301A6216
MKYSIINEGEDLAFTRQELDKRYVSSEEYEKLGDVNADDCQIYKRGEVWVVEYDNKVLYDEWHNKNYPFFENAFHLMNVEERASWKTVNNLTAFRQALREDAVNGRGLADMLEEPLTEEVFNKFMKMSRAADLLHHGDHTF